MAKNLHLCTAVRRAIPTILPLLLVSACAIAAREPINCSIPRTDSRMNQCVTTVQASELGACISADVVSEHTCVLMDQDLEYCSADSVINFTAIFNTSSKTLDCKGGVIDHGWSPVSSRAISPIDPDKQLPYVRFFDDRSLENITVKNCTMRGGFHAGIEMTRFFGGELGGDGEIGPDEQLPIGHKNVLLEDLTIEGGQTGIYLGNFSEDIHINRVEIDGTKRIAIYSEAGSHRVRITDSVISNNQSREAVAIDSTYNSLITNTHFINNREGAINLYQNCGELKGIVCPVVRHTPPNNNKIVGNTFINNGVAGIQIASRQGRKHSLGWCESLNGLPGKFTDEAINNEVSGNRFECSNGTAIVVKDGPNEIRNNDIHATENCVPVEISTGGFNWFKKSLLDGLVVKDNKIRSDRPPRLRNLSDTVVFD